jgi:hypothetical protein
MKSVLMGSVSARSHPVTADRLLQSGFGTIMISRDFSDPGEDHDNTTTSDHAARWYAGFGVCAIHALSNRNVRGVRANGR